MGATEPVHFTGHTGAGLYGGPAPTHKTPCPQSNNANGHNKECGCGWWAREQAEKLGRSGQPDTARDRRRQPPPKPALKQQPEKP